ncbi:hypothetical protein OIV83_005062 [Microbotryomycetes sp. JL201]|nr:hypothetical protein OIV83_005062 [Microbotryomycetes sp. JL201]
MPSSTRQLLDTFLDTTQYKIIPLTAKGVSEGCKVFGAAIFDKASLKPVVVATNEEKTSPILHGEINCIQQFYQIDQAERPEAKDCIFFATHEPCSLCLSGITWSGFDNFSYLFTYQDTRDAFSIPHDIDILEQVFRVSSKCSQETPKDLSERPLYNKVNKFFTSQSVQDLIDAMDDESERASYEKRANDVKAMYNSLSETYQNGKGGVGIPLA